MNYWETYYTGVNWMYSIYIIALNTPKYLHTKSMGFVLTYTKADFNTEIFMDISIEFGVEGVIWLDKNIYGIKDTDLT